MPYSTFENPYPNVPEFLTPAVLKKAYTTVIEQMPARIELISRYMRETRGYDLTPGSPLLKFDELPGVITSLGNLTLLASHANEANLGSSDPKESPLWISNVPRFGPDIETINMISDASLLWGEAFRHLYPESQWAMGAKPKSSIDYGYPLIKGVDIFGEQFNTRRLLMAHVCRLLLGQQNDKPLSWLTYKNAYRLGFIEDPYPTPMSDRERKQRGLI